MDEIAKSIEIFIENGDKEDHEIIELIVKEGFSSEFAERIVVFSPIAFGRQLIKQIADITFSDDIQIENTSGEIKTLKLSDDNIFTKLVEISEVIFTESSITKDQYHIIAGRSWELNGVNTVLFDLEQKTGKADASKLNGSKLSATKIYGYKTF